MRDCDRCQLYRNGDCAGLSCQGYKPIPFVDPEVMKSAQDANDNRRHRGNKYGSRSVAAREEKIKQAQSERKNENHKSKRVYQSGITENNRHDTDYESRTPVAVFPVKLGQKLFYKEKKTGIIKYGTIVGLRRGQFCFSFEATEKWLNNEMIGNRLFYTWQEANKNAKFRSQ